MGKVKNISIFWRMIKLKRLSYLQVINDTRDLSEAYQYFKKKYKEKWKKKTEVDEVDKEDRKEKNNLE